MSPGNGGANVISPGAEAVNVFMKKLSPPSTLRFSAPSSPPLADVVISMPGDMLTMAPLSAPIDSPDSRRSLSSAYDP